MAAPRWQQAKDVFQAALTRTPDARAAFLDEACDGDSELRREVESLLASHDEAGGFLSCPADLDTASREEARETGTEPRRIGPYRILDTIGRGGMGTGAVRNVVVFGTQAPVATLEQLLLLYLYSNQPKHLGDFAAIVTSTHADLAQTERTLASIHPEMLGEWRKRVHDAQQPPPPPQRPGPRKRRR